MENNESRVEIYKKYTAVQLRSWLERVKQKTTGTKAELILRLLSLPAAQRGEYQEETNNDDALSDDSDVFTDSANVMVEDMIARGVESTHNERQMNEMTADKRADENEGNQKSANEGKNKKTNEGNKQNERQLEDNTNDRHRMEQMEREIRLLKREIEIQAKEKHLMEKEIELLKKQNNNSGGGVAVAVLKELIPEFRGECFSHWETQFRNLVEAYNLDDNNARILISCRLGGNALKWFLSKVDLAQISTDQLMKEMSEMFISNESRLSLKREFEKRVWQTTETFQTYAHEKTIMANKLDLDKEEVLECLIDGIPDVRLRTQARMQCFTTKQQLMEAFRQIELPKIKSIIKMPTPVVSTPKCPAVPGPIPSTSRRVAAPEKLEAKQIRCYNCNSVGHYASECRKQKRQFGACHVCAQLGHLAAECPNRKAVILHTFEDDDEDYFEHY